MTYAINAAKTIVSITLQDGKGLLTLTKCEQGLGDVYKESNTDIQNLIPAEVWGHFTDDITFDFELQMIVRLTYDYVDPYEDNNGDFADTGFLLRSAIDGAQYHENEFDVPSGYVAHSRRLNNLKNLSEDKTDLVFDYHDLERICGGCYVYDEMGNFQGLKDLIEYLNTSDSTDWYTGSFNDSVTISIHKPR
jgi:hypothetical protein